MDIQIFDSNDAVLVFFDWLSRYTESDEFDTLPDAERRVLWDIEANLETALPEVVAGDYKDAVQNARHRISGADESE